ncbi:YesK family protein [Bacillus sp. AFS017336]|uniref:YesK family protein n=1 Tax=Bacillus sp. AFS017336 TaxID=2033489 RepID=UPI000BF08174|nr:hypothetical protein CN601_16245 [Bacillus sp. AFS017336]
MLLAYITRQNNEKFYKKFYLFNEKRTCINMTSYLLLTLILSCILIFVSTFLFRKRLHFRFIVPLVISIIGVVIIFLGIVIGGWNGMGLSAFGFSLFLASPIVFMAITLITFTWNHNN